MPYLEFPNISLLKWFTSLSSSIIGQKSIKNEGEQGKNCVSRNNLIKQSIYVLQTKELGNRETPLSWETQGLLWPRGCSLSKASLALNTVANPWPDFLELCHCPDILEIDATCFRLTGSFWGTSDVQNSIRLGPLVKAQGVSALAVIHHKWPWLSPVSSLFLYLYTVSILWNVFLASQMTLSHSPSEHQKSKT